MRFLPLVIFLALATSPDSSARAPHQELLRLLKSEYHTGSHSFDYLNRFVGDTLTLSFNSGSYSDRFRLVRPDTIWLKKRPKNNPKEGKHFVLCEAYRGIPADEKGRVFTTPVKDMCRPFILRNIGPLADGSGYALMLVDPSDGTRLNFIQSAADPMPFSFTSAKTDRLISLLRGTTLYYAPNASSDPRPYTIADGSFRVKVTVNKPYSYSSSSEYKANPSLSITLKPEGSGPSVTLAPQSRASDRANPVLITPEEYRAEYSPRTINSQVNEELLNDSTPFTFSTPIIIGTTTYSARATQCLGPNRRGEDCKSATISNTAILIADRLAFRGSDYYRACHNGKAFFIPASEVTLDKENQAVLDSLLATPQSERDRFANFTLAISIMTRMNRARELMAKYKEYERQGIAVEDWSIYDESEYTDGKGLGITFVNTAKSMIKYISFTVQGYNAVDDPVGRPVTLRCIGPIDPDHAREYAFDYVWFTDYVDYARLKSITVQYKNGTTKTIRKPESVMLDQELISAFTESNPVEDFD